MVYFYSVLCIAHILNFLANLGIGGPLNVGGPWLQPSQHPSYSATVILLYT